MPGGDGTGPDGKGGCGIPGGYLKFGRGGRFRNTRINPNIQNNNFRNINNRQPGNRGNGRGRGGGGGGWRRTGNIYPGNGPWCHLPPNKITIIIK
ncbi:MAG: hypothetical protein ACTSRP_25025 [Candidatus Helarchaeota archaeon]